MSGAFKTTVKLDAIFAKKFDGFRKEAAQVMVSMVAAEFVDLLHNAPQYSGNYVANMAVASGETVRGKKPADPNAMPPLSRSKEDRAKAFARGQLPAIEKAKAENANLKKNLTAHITRSAGWATGVTVYNRLAHADEIEMLGPGPGELRYVNREGAHAMTKFGMKLEARINARVVYGTSDWYRYLGANYV